MTRTVNRYLSPDELDKILTLDQSSIKLLDASFALPGALPRPEEIYQQKRIANAGFFDIDKAADPDSDLPHMMPTEEIFADYVGQLGIENNDHVIIYGQSGIAMGPCRALWMFEAFGHHKVSLLNASLNHWEKQGFHVNTTPPPRVKSTSFKARLHCKELARIEDVKKAIERQSATILDARPPERFSGQVKEPREGLRSGHMPGALNIPAGRLIDPETGGFIKHQDIQNLIRTKIPGPDTNVITTCGSGVTACVLREALQVAGYKDISVYDGSWSEWGRNSLETKVSKI